MAFYQIRIFKGWETRDSLRRWVNNYEIDSPAASPADLVAAAQGIVDAEKLVHLTAVQFLSMTISTWAPDSQPYNPNSFVTVGISGAGTRALPEGVHALDTNVAWFVQRNASTGRQGKLFYRGCLLETDVEQGSDGYFKFTPGTPLAPGGALLGSWGNGMFPYMTGGPGNHKFVLIGVSKNSVNTHVRQLVGWTSAGIVVNRRNHRYFDRGLG